MNCGIDAQRESSAGHRRILKRGGEPKPWQIVQPAYLTEDEPLFYQEHSEEEYSRLLEIVEFVNASLLIKWSSIVMDICCLSLTPSAMLRKPNHTMQSSAPDSLHPGV